MRSVEMIVEFPIEDANLPMPHLLGLANAAFVEEVERQGLLLMSPPSPSVMHARRIVEVRAAVVEKPDWAPPPPSGYLLAYCSIYVDNSLSVGCRRAIGAR